jgi:hypothetical protein
MDAELVAELPEPDGGQNAGEPWVPPRAPSLTSRTSVFPLGCARAKPGSAREAPIQAPTPEIRADA